MTMLNIEPNLARPDDFYEALLEMHADLDAAQSRMADARLILLLANHIGDPDVLLEAIRRARGDTGGAADGQSTFPSSPDRQTR